MNKKTFLFSLRDDSSIVKLKYVKYYEVNWRKDYMGIFGSGNGFYGSGDIVIQDNCNSRSDNGSYLGSSLSSFEIPNV